MPELATNHSDVRLMELAARNPSLGGRALLQEILERGSALETNERLTVQDAFAAFTSHELDHPDYRTSYEQAQWLHGQSQAQRDLYERGAMLKGEVLVIPAEEYELDEEREQPFITTLAYAVRKLNDPAQAREFHALAHTISGQSADARTQIAVFKTYYDRLSQDERGERNAMKGRSERASAVTQTLAEMRSLAAEMEKLETRESSDALPFAEEREGQAPVQMNVAARRSNLREEALRLPVGLSYEQKERLVTMTIPEIDRRLEQGISRALLVAAIDGTMRRSDAATSRAVFSLRAQRRAQTQFRQNKCNRANTTNSGIQFTGSNRLSACVWRRPQRKPDFSHVSGEYGAHRTCAAQ